MGTSLIGYLDGHYGVGDVLAPIMHGQKAIPPMGDLICPPNSQWPCPAETAPAEGTAGCIQPKLQYTPPGGARVGDSGRDWVVWLWSREQPPHPNKCLTMLAPSSPILPTLVTPPYQARALWKDLWVVASLGTLYSLSLESSGGRPGNLRHGGATDR